MEHTRDDSQSATAALLNSKSMSQIVSIRFLLVFIFLVGTVLTGTLAWHLTYDSATKSIRSISIDMQYEVQGRLSDSLDDKIAHAESLLHMNQDFVRNAGIVFDNHGLSLMMQLFLSQIKHNRDSSTCTLTTQDGQLWGYFISPEDGNYGLWKTVNGTTYEYKVDEDGSPGALIWSDDSLDSSTGLWYTMVDQTNPESAIWTPLYVWVDRLWSSRSMGAYDAQGNWLGVVTTDMEFGFVSILLKEIRDRRNSDTLVVNELGQVIGTSLDISIQVCLPIGDPNCSLEPSNIANVTHPLARSVHAYVTGISSGGWLTLDESTRVVTRSVKGTRYIMNFSGIRRKDITWTLVTIVPEDEFLGDIQKNNQRTIIAVFCLIAGLTICILFFGIYVTRPLTKVAKAMQNISRLNFDQVKLTKRKSSYLREIKMIESSFRAMDTALRSFGKFVPMAVVKRIVHDIADQRKLFVERREVTILFSDVAGFTSLSESLSPDVLMTILSEYLNEMSQLVLENGGTVLDFIGDAIVALWNAPVDVPNHQKCGVVCAVKMQRCISKLNQDWIQRGFIKETLAVRIGLNSGHVMAGNIGCDSRMKYDAVGDSMNVAARLEALNKRYGSRILISEETLKHVADFALYRPIEAIAVKGRTAVTRVYELLSYQSEIPEHSAEYEELSRKIHALSRFHEVNLSDVRQKSASLAHLAQYTRDSHDLVASRILEIFSDPSYGGPIPIHEK
eukprot:TRINITY_DN5919_c0_g1_i4.p1 TRINITY_DN5919_c0_g1~~TRINITY_DN5919_c0_g1_i4.p1  ORF type:complete len:730 (-),score=131.28 TRINITY_DN5919_c0_g1_i4:1937-4126(-)